MTPVFQVFFKMNATHPLLRLITSDLYAKIENTHDSNKHCGHCAPRV